MATASKVPQAAKIGDEALKARTGKDWNQWYAVLDKSGAQKMDHKGIVTVLYDKLAIPGWWAQMIAAGYEQARGLRKQYQTPSGFEISRSVTVIAPQAVAFKSWTDEKTRSKWLQDSRIIISKATPPKSVRALWVDGKTRLSVDFYAKGPSKSQVTVQHLKLGSLKQAESMKNYWKAQLEKLKEVISA